MEVWQAALAAQAEARRVAVRERRAALQASAGGGGGGGGGGADIASRRATLTQMGGAGRKEESVSWPTEVLAVLGASPGPGLGFSAIQAALGERGLERRWFELRAPLKNLLKRGAARRALVATDTDASVAEKARSAKAAADARYAADYEAWARAEAARAAEVVCPLVWPLGRGRGLLRGSGVRVGGVWRLGSWASSL